LTDESAKPKRPKTPPLTDAERHQRFTNMVKEVGADESPEAFDRAFSSVTAPHKPAPEKPE
jgi:hypothetical protein